MLPVSEQTFSQEVLGSSVPVLVHFWAPWCGLCRMIVPMLTEFQAEQDGQIKLVGINADENLKLANTYRLTTLPTLLLVNHGEVIYRLDSFRGRDELQVALKKIVANYSYSA